MTAPDLVLDLSALPLSEGLRRLIADEKEEFETVLGRRLVLRAAEAGEDAWVIDPSSDAAPRLRWDAPGRLVSVAATEAEFIATLNAVHSLIGRDVEEVVVEPVASAEEATALVREEVGNTYPYFSLRGLDWDAICARHLGETPAVDDFSDFAAAWLAELGDAHTGIKARGPGSFNPPYRGSLDADGVHLSEVPADSAAWLVGVRPGWTVEIEHAGHFIRTVGASPQQLSQVRARRALAFTGEERTFHARGPFGQEADWVEPAVPPTADDTVRVARGSDGDLRVRVRAFDARVDLHAAFDDIFSRAQVSDHLTLDLRGNPGGSILLATDLRDRFLRERTAIGSFAFTDGRGGLGPRRERWAEPSSRSRWPGTLDILIDAMTYSASEDFILGLQGLEHVTVTGSRTGGGSGRPRRIPILPGIDLSVSTAVTYDRRGRPVEFRGIHPDEGRG
ncbi:S41 family peptidase [Microbacterium sp. NPDC057659]|uniref:S41 family peptidase n=1 Tax=Microbacterium sp. NPDC057659 TaxID=3346198 RepID=UPI00366E1847